MVVNRISVMTEHFLGWATTKHQGIKVLWSKDIVYQIILVLYFKRLHNIYLCWCFTSQSKLYSHVGTNCWASTKHPKVLNSPPWDTESNTLPIEPLCSPRLHLELRFMAVAGGSVVDSLLIVTPIVEFCNCSMFSCVHSSFAIISMGKRELVALLCLLGVSWLLCGSSSLCHGFVCSLWLWDYLIILNIFYGRWLGYLNLSPSHFTIYTYIPCPVVLSTYRFLFDSILYVPSTIFQLNRDRSSWVEPELS